MVSLSLLRIFSFCFIYHLLILGDCVQNGETVFSAISEVVNHFAKITKTIDLVTSVSENKKIDELLTALLNRHPEVSMRISSVSVEKKEKVTFESAVLIVFESFKTFVDFHDKFIFTNQFTTAKEFLVYCVDASSEDVSKMNMKPADKISFLLEEQDSFVLETLFWFSPDQCNKPQLVNINRFSKREGKWISDEFFPEKFENFYGCQLVFTFDEKISAHFTSIAEPGERTATLKEGTLVENGFIVDLVKDFAKDLNYSAYFNPPYLGQSYVWRNKDLFNYNPILSTDLVLNFTRTTVEDDAFVIREPILSDEMSFLIPKGDFYTPFEKLFLPFSYGVWILLILAFVIATIVINILFAFPKKYQDFVFGRLVKYPVYNLYVAFMGGSQLVLPGRNFARFLLMMFILFSIVIRTCYQGEMFRYMTTDEEKKEFQTFQELIDDNFTFLVDAPFFDSLVRENLLEGARMVVQETSRLQRMQRFTRRQKYEYFEDFKFCVLGGKFDVAVLNTIMDQKDYLLLEERIYSVSLGLGLPRTHYLKEPFYKRISRHQENGIINFWFSFYPESLNPKFINERREAKKEPMPLTLFILSAGFKVCFVPMALAAIVFAFELFQFYVVQAIYIKKMNS